MAYWRSEEEIDPGEWGDIYLRLTRVGHARYALDLWVRAVEKARTVENHLRVERDLPNGLVTYINRLLNETYYQPYVDDLRAAATEIWEGLFPEELRSVARELITEDRLRDLLEAALDIIDDLIETPQHVRIRLELRDPMLYYLPWEYLPIADWVPEQILGYPARLTLPSFDVGALKLDLPLRILFVSASPERSKVAIDESMELGRLEAALTQLVGDQIELVALPNADTDALASALSESWFHILHVVGHGFVSPSGPLLALQSEKRSQFLSPGELGALARAGGVRLLTMQTPFSAQNYQIAAFAGFAAQARTLGLPAMLYELRPDDKPIPDVARVYASIVQGMALDEACVRATRATPEGPVLALSLHTKQNRLFHIGPSLESVEKETLEKASYELYSIFSDPESEEHKTLTKLIEEGAPASAVAGVLVPQVLRHVPSAAASTVAQSVAQQLVSSQALIDAPPDLRSLQQKSRVRRKQLLQQIDFVQENVSHLERMQRTYAKSPLPWLDTELQKQKSRLEQLSVELKDELEEEA